MSGSRPSRVGMRYRVESGRDCEAIGQAGRRESEIASRAGSGCTRLRFFFKFINFGTGHRVDKTLFQTHYLFHFISQVKLGVSASKL